MRNQLLEGLFLSAIMTAVGCQGSDTFATGVLLEGICISDLAKAIPRLTTLIGTHLANINV